MAHVLKDKKLAVAIAPVALALGIGCGGESVDECEEISPVYGPMPCTSDEQCQQQYGDEHYVCGQEQSVKDSCGNWIVQRFCQIDEVADAGTDASLDAAEECEPTAVYGPRPCETDDECVEREGPEAYCDQENGFEDPCLGWVSWPTCKVDELPDAGADVTDECEPVVYYGPQPCQSDDECVDAFGPGYECDETAQIEDPCQGWISYPQCVMVDAGAPDATDDCSPMAWYGPPPCTDDDECIDEYGAGWFCDLNNEVQDPCAGPVSYPVCKPVEDK